jgi:hypothetical protein
MSANEVIDNLIDQKPKGDVYKEEDGQTDSGTTFPPIIECNEKYRNK